MRRVLALNEVDNICVLFDGGTAGSLLWFTHTDLHPLQKVVLHIRQLLVTYYELITSTGDMVVSTGWISDGKR